MEEHDELHDWDEAEALEGVLERLKLTASKLGEIMQLLQEPGRVEAMMARYEQFTGGLLPVTVQDISAGGPDEACGVTRPPHGT